MTSFEERFNEKFVNHGEFVYNKGGYPAVCGEIKAFIKSELDKRDDRRTDGILRR